MDSLAEEVKITICLIALKPSERLKIVEMSRHQWSKPSHVNI